MFKRKRRYFISYDFKTPNDYGKGNVELEFTGKVSIKAAERHIQRVSKETPNVKVIITNIVRLKRHESIGVDLTEKTEWGKKPKRKFKVKR